MIKLTGRVHCSLQGSTRTSLHPASSGSLHLGHNTLIAGHVKSQLLEGGLQDSVSWTSSLMKQMRQGQVSAFPSAKFRKLGKPASHFPHNSLATVLHPELADHFSACSNARTRKPQCRYCKVHLKKTKGSSPAPDTACRTPCCNRL